MKRKNSNALKDIGHNIQIARLEKGLTQEVLAEKCDVSTKHISALERGVSSGSISLIIDICNVLGVTPNYIFRTAVDIDNDDKIDIFAPETLLSYIKLQEENKDFIDYTINHLYFMQKKR